MDREEAGGVQVGVDAPAGVQDEVAQEIRLQDAVGEVRVDASDLTELGRGGGEVVRFDVGGG